MAVDSAMIIFQLPLLVDVPMDSDVSLSVFELPVGEGNAHIMQLHEGVRLGSGLLRVRDALQGSLQKSSTLELALLHGGHSGLDTQLKTRRARLLIEARCLFIKMDRNRK